MAKPKGPKRRHSVDFIKKPDKTKNLGHRTSSLNEIIVKSVAIQICGHQYGQYVHKTSLYNKKRSLAYYQQFYRRLKRFKIRRNVSRRRRGITRYDIRIWFFCLGESYCVHNFVLHTSFIQAHKTCSKIVDKVTVPKLHCAQKYFTFLFLIKDLFITIGRYNL